MALLATVLVVRGGLLFTPGELSAGFSRSRSILGFTAHADFEAECSLCHQPWKGASSALCEECHSEVLREREQSSGLHGRFVNASLCRDCHTEHHGRGADITRFVLSTAQHLELSGFSLARHEEDFGGQPQVCEGCHAGDSYEEVECFECHSEHEPDFMKQHAEHFGLDCLECHDGLDRMIPFEHNQYFVLDGAHLNPTCDRCHVQQQFQGTPRHCSGCHLEPGVHAGQFGLDCARCHLTREWLPARLEVHNFPLDHGDGGRIECQRCHNISYVSYTCFNCHAHDPFETLEEHLEEGITQVEDCAECHPTGTEDEAEELAVAVAK